MNTAAGEPASAVRIGLIFFEDHPYGRVVITRLIEAGYVPTLCLEERSAVSKQRSAWYSKQLKLAEADVPTVDEIRAGHPFERVLVEDMNNEKAKEVLSSAHLDVIFLGGAGIMQPEVFSLAHHGCLNTHPGKLPDIRGSLPVAQSIVRDIPLAVTLHRVTAVLDCGGWVNQQPIPVFRDSSFEDLIYSSCQIAGDLFVFAARQIESEGRIIEEAELPMSAFGPNMKWDKGIETEARIVLKAGSYAHYND